MTIFYTVPIITGYFREYGGRSCLKCSECEGTDNNSVVNECVNTKGLRPSLRCWPRDMYHVQRIRSIESTHTTTSTLSLRTGEWRRCEHGLCFL